MEKVGNLLGKILEGKSATKKDTAPVERPSSPTPNAAGAQPRPPLSSTEVSSNDDSARPRYPQKSRRFGPRSELTLVKSVLAKALAKKGLDKQVERYEFVLHWEEIVGESIAKICRPEYIMKKSLVVRVSHSAWAQELTFMKPVLLQKLAPFLNRGDVVQDIIFKVGSNQPR